eukprot:XP_001689928.1 peptidyl-prolyl cis-trans isomerase, FKBP-type [Chlamydomonas reinhardtii]
MGLPYPTRQRPYLHYFPLWATLLMVCTIIFICIWIHYTQAMIFAINATLDVLGEGTAADNFSVLSQSVIATSILYFIYGSVMYGLCLWWSLLEVEADQIGQVKDKMQLFMMSNLTVRVCWWAIMTWMVVLLAGAAIFGVYTSNLSYMITTVLNNQAMVGGYPDHTGPYPDCPATCLDLWVIDYIDTPMDTSCVCNRSTLMSALTFAQQAKDSIAGALVGVFFMYIIGGYWRSELARHYATCRTMQDVQLEPELKPQRVKLDKKIREEQALAQGAVLSAVLEEGDGGPSPKEGDLVYIQYSIRDLEDDLLYSTRSEEGGSGQAYAFLLERGVRVPRGWEIAIQGMSKGARSVLQVKPGYGFAHPDCAMQPPVRDLPTDQGVHQYGAGEALIKRALREGTAWESPRPPFEVTLHLTASCPAYDGLQLTGQRLFSSRGEGRQPLNLQLGRGLLPPGVEEALSFMSKGELAAFVVELEVELISMVQVRDMTGTGEVTKKRLREGTGDFPIDCPLNDTTVSRVVAAPRFAYAGREDCPAGVGDAASTTVEFEVELVDFEREGHWQNLSFEARYTLAERLKSKGNDLFKRGQHKFARARYERLLRLLDSTRDFETEEEVAKIDGYKVATLGNLALCLSQLTEYAAAVAVCDKALEFEPENAKMWFRKGKALSLKGDYEEAAEVLKHLPVPPDLLLPGSCIHTLERRWSMIPAPKRT